jgi:hypothetical protein
VFIVQEKDEAGRWGGRPSVKSRGPYAVTYEDGDGDGDGDWLLVGDVPWE